MADMFTKEKRSQIMARIGAKNTGIEREVFAYLRKHGVHFQRHYDKAPGKPDIALPSKKLAVFIHGDFWHGYRFFSWKNRVPREYWLEKITSNILRDRRHAKMLRRNGWRALRIWGHEVINSPEETGNRVAEFLRS